MWRIWAAALFWGLNWPVIKVLLTGAGPWTLRAAGLTGGAVLLVGGAHAGTRGTLAARDRGREVADVLVCQPACARRHSPPCRRGDTLQVRFDHVAEECLQAGPGGHHAGPGGR